MTGAQFYTYSEQEHSRTKGLISCVSVILYTLLATKMQVAKYLAMIQSKYNLTGIIYAKSKYFIPEMV